MCGILGYIGSKEAAPLIIGGLRRLEYRGYDSAGLAVISPKGLLLRRAVGKLSALEAVLKKNPVQGQMGLGHTRWATHGAPSELNAHPHTDEEKKIIVVHNGIIENYLPLKKKLIRQGFQFKSETDTEVVAHLIASYWKKRAKRKEDNIPLFVKAVQQALKEIHGTFALGVICTAVPNVLIAARRDCPLIVGLGENENFIASDVPAVLDHTRDVLFLNDDEMAVVTEKSVVLLGANGRPVKRTPSHIEWNPAQAEKSGYKHFMLKEIYEQPRVVEDTLLGRLNVSKGEVTLDQSGLTEHLAKRISHVRFVACGTSWHAGLIGAYLLERYAKIPCQVDIASEFRYRNPVMEDRTLVVAISQSGETADTLAAVRLAKKKGARVLAITNVVGSSITRDAHGMILTQCGPEIGVASTKAFIGQLVTVYLLAMYLARLRRTQTLVQLKSMARHLAHLSQWITSTLKCEPSVRALAQQYFEKRSFLFVGRNLNYPVAMEGALKLKEISYIHAEGYPAGELKHGPIALIDSSMPVVAIVTKSAVSEKMRSNMEEVKSRGGDVIAIATRGDKLVGAKVPHVIFVPDVPEDLTPMINVIPLQLLAYHISVLRGCDVDQPRNLAKSVTVE